MREPGELFGRAGLCLLAALTATTAGSAMAFAERAAIEHCTDMLPFASAKAAGARDGTTVRLNDGREVRLAGIAAPRAFDGDPVAAERARAALHALVAGRSIVLYAAAEEQDRHGRMVAQAVLDDDHIWLQAELTETGTARVMPGAGVPDCARALLAVEGVARAARAGFWRSSIFRIEDAAAVPEALVRNGRYALVEASVHRVGESGGRIYLDFGRRYTKDFTVVIPRSAQKAFAEAGVDLRALAGQRVRARGMLFFWGGPAMELHEPAALELVGTDEE